MSTCRVRSTGSGESCLMEGTCCMDYQTQKAGSWKSCPGGCKNSANPNLAVGGEARTDVEGCCWWGRGVIQTTGVCNFGKLNFFAGKKAADAGRSSLYPTVDFCADPAVICRDDHPDLKWVAGFFYWLESVQSYDEGGGTTGRERGVYMDVLKAWVDNGARLSDTSLVDFASGVVNRGCHDSPHEGSHGADPCGNGEVHAVGARRKNFAAMMKIFSSFFGNDGRRLAATTDAAARAPPPPSSRRRPAGSRRRRRRPTRAARPAAAARRRSPRSRPSRSSWRRT